MQTEATRTVFSVILPVTRALGLPRSAPHALARSSSTTTSASPSVQTPNTEKTIFVTTALAIVSSVHLWASVLCAPLRQVDLLTKEPAMGHVQLTCLFKMVATALTATPRAIRVLQLLLPALPV